MTEEVRRTPLCGERACRGRVGGFGSRVDLLTQVSVQNDAAAESLYGETLPGSRTMIRFTALTVFCSFFLEGTK